MKKTYIVCCFPGIGRTTATSKLNSPEFVMFDIHADDFRWTRDVPPRTHPYWPDNYVRHIRNSLGKADVILISSYGEVRKLLRDVGIGFILAYPSLHMEKEFIQRQRERPHQAELKSRLGDYKTWVVEHMNEQGCEHVVLEPGQYLENVLPSIFTMTPACV